jgi:transposase-like protein
MDTPRTLLEAVKHFSDPNNCREYLVARRWPNGVSCPTCGSKSVYFDKSRNGWECKTRHPKRKFTLKTGTIFEDSPLGFDKWLPAVWMIANCKNGVSSWELHRAIGVTQKTAWFMLQRIRLAMQDADTGGKLGGEVEIDETYIGGKARNMHKSKRERLTKTKFHPWAGKIAVMGLLERHPDGGSRVRTMTVPNVRQTRLHGHIREQVEAGSTLYTDALNSYKGLTDYQHNVIDHAECLRKR